jgi:hypothetical protein
LLADIISDKICSKTNKPNQGQVTELAEKITAMRSWYRIYTKIQNGHTRMLDMNIHDVQPVAGLQINI